MAARSGATKSSTEKARSAEAMVADARAFTAAHGFNLTTLITIGAHVIQDVIEVTAGSPVSEILPVKIPGSGGKRAKITVELVD
jgi:hypothetical protein